MDFPDSTCEVTYSILKLHNLLNMVVVLSQITIEPTMPEIKLVI